MSTAFFYSVFKACAAFVFGSKETPVGKGVILARFKIFLLRKGGFDGAAEEIEEEARLRRELRKTEILAKTKKQQALMLQQEVAIDEGLEILEKRRAGREAKRVEIVERQHDQVKQVQNTADQQKALEDLNRKRDENASDAAAYVHAAESAIRLVGGKVTVDEESLKAIGAFAQAAKQAAEEERRAAEAAKRERVSVVPPAPPAPPAAAKPAPTVWRSGKRISEIAKELGVPTKIIIAKCIDEGVPADKVMSHTSHVPIGLEMSIREWFSEASIGSVTETAEKVEPKKLKVRTPRAKRKSSSSAASEQSEG